MSTGGKIPTNGGEGLGQNPFGTLRDSAFPKSTRPASTQPSASPEGTVDARPEKNRGRVDVRRETGNRGGKTVTVIDGFTGIGLPEKEQLAKKIRTACGCGGTVKGGAIEIQGDQRATVTRILTEAGFRPVLAGG
jgi:translation initiation factor 1